MSGEGRRGKAADARDHDAEGTPDTAVLHRLARLTGCPLREVPDSGGRVWLSFCPGCDTDFLIRHLRVELDGNSAFMSCTEGCAPEADLALLGAAVGTASEGAS